MQIEVAATQGQYRSNASMLDTSSSSARITILWAERDGGVRCPLAHSDVQKRTPVEIPTKRGCGGKGPIACGFTRAKGLWHAVCNLATWKDSAWQPDSGVHGTDLWCGPNL